MGKLILISLRSKSDSSKEAWPESRDQTDIRCGEQQPPNPSSSLRLPIIQTDIRWC